MDRDWPEISGSAKVNTLENRFSSALLLLGKSDFLAAGAISHVNLSAIRNSVLLGNSPEFDLSTLSLEDLYIAYRTLEFNYARDFNMLRLLPRILIEINSKNSEGGGLQICIQEMSAIEYDYLIFYDLSDNEKKATQVRKLKSFLEKYPENQRIKYMYGKLCFDFGMQPLALPILNGLFAENYYQLPVFKMLFNYYGSRNVDSLRHYSSLFQKIFPLECNDALFIDFKNVSLTDLEAERIKCIQRNSDQDSIFVSVMIAWKFLAERNFQKSDSMFVEFILQRELMDVNKRGKWEYGEMVDIHLRSLFLNRKYSEMLKFIELNLQYNDKIFIQSEQDRRLLIEKYHREYFGNSEQFSDFYDKYFSK